MEQMDEEPEEVSEWRRVKESLAVNKPLIPLKATMLLIYGASSLFLPYLTLHMVQIGLNIEEIAGIYAALPFITFLAPPLAGLLADRFNSYKLFLVCLVSSSAFFHTMLLFIDANTSERSSMVRSPEVTTAQLSCSRIGSTLRFDNFDCTQALMSMGNWSASLTLSQCEAAGHCPIPPSSGMLLCSTVENCTRIASSSPPTDIAMDFQLLVTQDGDNCSVWMVDVEVAESSLPPAALFCNCETRCPVTVKLPFILSDNDADVNQTLLDETKHQQGFGVYFLVRIVASSSLAATFSMLDATAICMVKNCQGDLGKQRLFGVIGQAVFAMIGGLLLDWSSQIKGVVDYSVVIYLADGIFLVVIFLIGRLDVDVERFEGNLKTSLRQLVRMIDVDFFFFMMLLLGACWGFLESFLFVFLIELNASSYLLGTTVTLGCVVGIPFLYISDTIVRKIGSVDVIVIAFLLYGVRFFGYSFIRDSWLCLPFEALEAVTVHLMAVASSMYCAAASPPGLLATMNGAVSSLHYSFGRGMGSFIGGILMVTYGTRTAFRVFGISAFICGIFYFFLHRFYLIRMEQERLQKKIEHIAEVMADSAAVEDDELGGQFIIPPDNLMGRRISCF